MSMLRMELMLIVRSGLGAGSLVLMVLLSALAVWSGLGEVEAQRRELARINASHRADVALVAHKYKDGGEAGYAGYSTPHLTTNPPSALAFAAIGQRDIQPTALRVRLLGLQAQLYESESINPELALSGRFDFAFVLAYLAPLVAIALMHDLVAGEREAGRLRLLASLPSALMRTWGRRIGLRFVLVWSACALPLLVGCILSGAGGGATCLIMAAALLYLGFWFGLSAGIAATVRTAAAGAAISLACLVLLTLIVPTVLNVAINRAVPVASGVEIAMAQRQAVHQGWDLPKAETLAKFFRTHPEWRDTAPVTGRFHWKWYYAMQQAGDDAVAPLTQAYRQSMSRRNLWTERAGWLLPSVGIQVLLHRVARTDLAAQLDYQALVTAFHTGLRRFYYPYIFEQRSFGPADFALLPAYAAEDAPGRMPILSLFCMGLVGALSLALGGVRLARS